jgi:hypothetical protein
MARLRAVSIFPSSPGVPSPPPGKPFGRIVFGRIAVIGGTGIGLESDSNFPTRIIGTPFHDTDPMLPDWPNRPLRVILFCGCEFTLFSCVKCDSASAEEVVFASATVRSC